MDRSAVMRWICVAVLPLAACRHAPPAEHPLMGLSSPMARQARETAMNSVWQNHTLSELVAAKGRPVLVMQIPGGGNPPGFVVVYGIDPDTGCIDAFAVSHDGDPRVRIYHCR
ncbi:hypothetical protein [Ramlibacter albus]|uniref:Uncharacterized protein n=1 Tax=Ramlibacter albus TaxID=2079448 RepID=A0A923S1T0_9BURK|nr:hypothetical protein [Ramlibacter albus]MBC5764018.1 hypothetical protein [Ramlibacter albus]